MGYSKNRRGEEIPRWVHSKDVYDKWCVSQKGFSVGPTTDWENSKLWGDDPIMLPYKQAARTGRFAGYQGPSTRKAAEVVTKYIIIDMYAKAVQGMPAEEAVEVGARRAAQNLRRLDCGHTISSGGGRGRQISARPQSIERICSGACVAVARRVGRWTAAIRSLRPLTVFELADARPSILYIRRHPSLWL